MRCIEAASTLPVFRPLLTYDKHETIAIAEQIDTFETSILPHPDCCTLFVPKHPSTKLPIPAARRAEENLAVEDLVVSALESTETQEIGC